MLWYDTWRSSKVLSLNCRRATTTTTLPRMREWLAQAQPPGVVDDLVAAVVLLQLVFSAEDNPIQEKIVWPVRN